MDKIKFGNNVYKLRFVVKKMKRGLNFLGIFVFLGVLLLINLSIVSAAIDCVSDNDIVFRYSSETNAHAEVWNGAGDYTEEVCYSDIKGIEGSGDRICSGTNSVLKLSASTNAHVENPEATNGNYETAVCYGDLNCRVIPSDEALVDGDVIVGYLSQETNAHFSKTNPGEAYNFKLVCQGNVEGDVDPTGFEWFNYIDESITNSCLGHVVKLKISNTFTTDTEVSVEIWREDALVDNLVDSFTATISQNNDMTDWQVNEDTESIIGNDVYFKVTYNGESYDSGILNINTPENCINNIPVAEIIRPVDGSTYILGSEIVYEGTCTDPDGPPGIQWYVRNSEGVRADSNEESFVYTPAIAEQQTVTLECIDHIAPGEVFDEEQSTYLVVDDSETNIAALISKPSWKSVQYSDDDSLLVDYSALGSYVLKTIGLDTTDPDACTGTIECLAGTCPAEISGTVCSGLSIQNGGSDLGLGDVDFTWDFSEGADRAKTKGAFDGAHFFNQPSSSANDKFIEVILNYLDDGGNELEENARTEFTVLGNSLCRIDVNSGEAFIYVIDTEASSPFDPVTGDLIYSEIKNVNDIGVSCAYRIGSNDESCCPVGLYCNEEGNCVSDEEEIPTSCDYYTDNGGEDACEEDELDLYLTDSFRESLDCNEGDYRCECGWSSNQDKCGLKQIAINDNDPTCAPTTAPSCTYTSLENQGELCGDFEGVKQVTLNAQLNEGTCGSTIECGDKIVTIDCSKKGVRLPFFTAWQFVLSIVSIMGLYYIMFLASKRKND